MCYNSPDVSYELKLLLPLPITTLKPMNNHKDNANIQTEQLDFGGGDKMRGMLHTIGSFNRRFETRYQPLKHRRRRQG